MNTSLWIKSLKILYYVLLKVRQFYERYKNLKFIIHKDLINNKLIEKNCFKVSEKHMIMCIKFLT